MSERERETRKIGKTGVLIALNTSKRFALTASAFRLVSGDFQSSGKGRSHQNWYKLGYGSTPRPDATRAFAHNLQHLENYTIDFRDRSLKTKLVQ